MPADASVTRWLDLLKSGNREAVRPLWERYFHRLVLRARAALRDAPRRVADEEDIALSAFDSFCRGAEQGRFPRLDGREALWHTLLLLTARKAGRYVRDELSARRGGGRVWPETELCPSGTEDGSGPLTQVIGTEPTPELAAELAEEARRLLDRLGDNELRWIAVWQLEGYTVDEIAARMRRSPRTIARKLQVIRDLWQSEQTRA
jgi:DNA-directed RNA polymerase specialized sigma24 family protein